MTSICTVYTNEGITAVFSNVIRLIAINLGYKLGFFSLKQPICNDCFNPLF